MRPCRPQIPRGLNMANELVLIEMTIRKGDAFLDKADQYGTKSVEMKKSAGLTYLEAKGLCLQVNLPWKETCKKYTGRSYSQVAKVLQIVLADDPHAEIE